MTEMIPYANKLAPKWYFFIMYTTGNSTIAFNIGINLEFYVRPDH